MPNYEWSKLPFVHWSRLPKNRCKFNLSQFSEWEEFRRKKTHWSIYDIHATLLLSSRKIFPVVAEIRLLVSTYPRIRAAKGIEPYSTLSFFGIYALWSTKFFTDVKHPRDCLSWKFDGGYSRKFLENRKNRQIYQNRFGSISVLVNRSQQLLGIFLCKCAVM